jgi:hypothetical protein
LGGPKLGPIGQRGVVHVGEERDREGRRIYPRFYVMIHMHMHMRTLFLSSESTLMT